MTKKGFTLMELLVSIFISGMVMLALVAMWKTSSNQTAEAQRQSIIKNENTIFLRKLYSDFVSASEIICPPGHASISYPSCNSKTYIAVKGAVISTNTGQLQLKRITGPICGPTHNKWSDEMGEDFTEVEAMAGRCVKPSYVIYLFDDTQKRLFRCTDNFLVNNNTPVDVSSLINTAQARCSEPAFRELIMPYVDWFVFQSDSSSELKVDYTIRRDFGNDIPPVYFKFTRYFTRKRGV